ncbi:MAG TPA: alpha-amylase family glycosyl hydrolase [Cellvibrio sp.]|nr:alpha-amylase family glycosyl hydrolase [Cellvibrio sp.]
MIQSPRILKAIRLPLLALLMAGVGVSCSHLESEKPSAAKPFVWDNASVYFLITDRFNNGNPANDLAYGRKADGAPLRGFAGGDLAGVTAKIKSGYFEKLGVNVIWTTPIVEQIHAGTDEGTGKSYGFHGYWASDWTRVDANLGTMDEMREFVETAHAHGIRVLMDVVINHTGPVTEIDPVWPASWVRTSPTCTYKDPKTTIDCTLVKNLPDIRTDSNENVELPPALVKKWKAEGRYDQEVKELDEFFAKTGYPRAPRFYIMKWHADWIKKFGIDGFRVDTAKHTEPGVWKELSVVASAAFEEWKAKNPSKKLSDDPFFMTGEVYGYGIGHEKKYDMGANTYVNWFDYGFHSLINFSFVYDAKKSYEETFSAYSGRLNGGLQGYSVLNYIASHDDGNSHDRERLQPLENANKLLLAPGAAQIYYGDETSRDLLIKEATGDAQLRSFMNWDELAKNIDKHGFKVADVHEHWSKLARFRQAHPAIGAGVHQMLQEKPYTFKRTYDKSGVTDKVVVALDLPTTAATAIDVQGVFANGQKVRDAYSGNTAVVANGKVQFASKNAVVLIEQF